MQRLATFTVGYLITHFLHTFYTLSTHLYFDSVSQGLVAPASCVLLLAQNFGEFFEALCCTQKAMHHAVRVAPDGRGEMRVVTHGLKEMTRKTET